MRARARSGSGRRTVTTTTGSPRSSGPTTRTTSSTPTRTSSRPGRDHFGDLTARRPPMGELIDADGVRLWAERRGQGPDVLLVSGLGDPAEAWQSQLDGLADRYRITAFDNRGVGRTPLPEGPLSVPGMADDAAALLRALDVPAAHVTGFSGGSFIAQEMALRHPGLVRSLVLMSTMARPDPYFRAVARFWHWMAERAPSERAMLEAFFLWVYTPRAHADGMVDRFVEET
ncbi:conserved hypothetical protein, partial [Streptomyces viridochromogenes DSM 40736]